MECALFSTTEARPPVTSLTGSEVRYEAKKSGRSTAAVRGAVKKVGVSRKVERELGR